MDTLQAQRAVIRTRIDAVRNALTRRQLAALVVPSSDPHLSEYLPERWQGRQWLTGFTGSVGTLVVTPDFAGLWVDSRYWVQAEAQLAGTGITLMKVNVAASTAHIDWLAEHMPAGARVAIDGAVVGLAVQRQLAGALAARGAQLATDIDLLDEIWPERPGLPTAAVYEHKSEFVATDRGGKLGQLRAAMQAHGAQWHFISTLDDLAWLFNLRGADVSYNPVFVGHALIGMDRATLFIGEGKVPPKLADALESEGIDLKPYDWAPAALGRLPANATLLVDPKRITFGLRNAVPASVRVLEAINPTTLLKSRKTEVEVAHIRRAMEHDGAALAEFFAWFEAAVARGERITELTIDEQICAARARRPGLVSPSFPTIAGFNANGAMPHYRATEESHAVIEGEGLLLIDSGGQYEYGTTDITRVVQVRATTAAQRRDFTLVLKGMINLSRAVFPRGTKSPLLDTLARAPIWSAGVDFGHGTGHGVGYFLNVHEGPHGITPHLPPEPQTAMEPGMITSNEPGIYRAGLWGVRIENLVLNVPADTGAERAEFGEFLKFETLTLCPIDVRCIDRGLMSAEEIAWLNAYHAEVNRRVAPLVSGEALAWLKRSTAAI
ncbi:MAG: aminopeptidase P family protein [Burkholderiales bacterium]|nr:aminopeptidase P family protein [Burkholderiales bacterium]